MAIRNYCNLIIFFVGIQLLSGCGGFAIEVSPRYAKYSERQRQYIALRYIQNNSLESVDPKKVYLVTPLQMNSMVQKTEFDTLKIYYGKMGCPIAKDYLKNNMHGNQPKNLLLFGGTDDWAWIKFLDYDKHPLGVYKFVLNDSVTFNANPNKSLKSVYEFYKLSYDSLTNFKLVLTYNKNKELVKIEK